MGAQHILRAAARHHAAGGGFTLPTLASAPYHAQLPSGLDALTDGAAISSWADDTGNTRDYAQATAGNRPTKQTVSGHSAARFTTDDWLMISKGSPFITGQGVTNLLVARLNSVVTNACLTALFDHAATNDFGDVGSLLITDSLSGGSNQSTYRSGSPAAAIASHPGTAATFVLITYWDGVSPEQGVRRITSGGTVDATPTTVDLAGAPFNVDRILLGARWLSGAAGAPFGELDVIASATYPLLNSTDRGTLGTACAGAFL